MGSNDSAAIARGISERHDTYHHGNLRNALIKAAAAIVLEAGVEALSLRKLAARAGVSHAAPYRHFRDKESLLMAVAGEGFRMMEKETRDRLEACTGNALVAFRTCGLSYIDFALQHPAYYWVMFASRKGGQPLPDSRKPESTPPFRLMRETIVACQANGYLKTGNPDELALIAWSAVHGFAMLCIEHHIREDILAPDRLDQMKRQVVLSIYWGLRPDPGPNYCDAF